MTLHALISWALRQQTVVLGVDGTLLISDLQATPLTPATSDIGAYPSARVQVSMCLSA